MRDAIIRIPLFLATRLKMASAEMEGQVLEENAQALHFQGRPAIRPSDVCLRCGKPIKEEHAKRNGYGPDCWERIRLREGLFDDTMWKGWLPRRQVEILDNDGTAIRQEPAADPAASERLQEAKALEFTPRLYVKDERIHFKVPMSMNNQVREKTNPRFNSDERTWSYPATPENAEELMTIFYETKPEMDRGFEGLLQDAMRIKKANAVKMALELPPIPNTKVQPWHHQLQAFWFGKDLPGVMLALDMGTGKTKVAIDLVVNNGWRKNLILCPAKVVAVWPKEFKKHTDKEYMIIALDNGNWDVPRKIKEAEKQIAIANAKGIPYAVVISYDSCWRHPFGPKYVKQGRKNVLVDKGWAKAHGFECVICDESHKIKDPTSKASEFAAYIRDGTKQRIALTGTPMPHDPLDAFGQYRFLDPTIFGDTYILFKKQYAVTPKNGPLAGKKVVGFKNEDELNRKFYSIAMRVESREVQDLPPFKDEIWPVQISAKARKHYTEIEKEMYTELESGPKEEVPVFSPDGEQIGTTMKPSSVSIKNALGKMLRLQQLTSGYLVDDAKNEVQVDKAKEETLEEILSDLPKNEPVIVFANFTHDIQAIRRVTEKLGRRYAELSGQRNDLVAACMPENADVMAVQIKSGGAGVDLTRAAYAIYYSATNNNGDYEQSRKRIDRPGQTRPVTYYHLIAEKTVDVKVYKALDEKKAVVEYVLGL